MKVKDVIKSDLAVSTEDGDVVCDKISTLLETKNKAVVDFADLDLITTAFLNNAIGKLYSRFNSDTLNKYLQITHVKETDIKLLMKVIEQASEKFEGSKYEEILKKELDNE